MVTKAYLPTQSDPVATIHPMGTWYKIVFADEEPERALSLPLAMDLLKEKFGLDVPLIFREVPS